MKENCQHHDAPRRRYHWCVIEIMSSVLWQWIFALVFKKKSFNWKTNFDEDFFLKSFLSWWHGYELRHNITLMIRHNRELVPTRGIIRTRNHWSSGWKFAKGGLSFWWS